MKERVIRVYTLVFRHLLFQPLHLSALSANEMWRRRGSGDNSLESDQISDGQSSSNEVQEVAVDTYRITTLQGLASRCCANLGKDQWPWYLSKQATQDHLWRYSLWRGHPWAGQILPKAAYLQQETVQGISLFYTGYRLLPQCDPSPGS
ncbi:uncharacterized protein LOC135147194 [Daucus carota subsp. sativus]|uniref:uncharacterized protein LOC135147194 n=1 Tax=Daucus carota subsp. sativus TaxID=79200 RepID=UPI003083990E